MDLEDRLLEIARSVAGRVTFSTSLGIEDQAVLNAIAASGAKIDVFTLDTGRHFPETLDTLEASENRYGLNIRVMFPDAREVEELVARDGIYGFRLAVENRKACCDIRKVRPLKRALEGAKGWVTLRPTGKTSLTALLSVVEESYRAIAPAKIVNALAARD